MLKIASEGLMPRLVACVQASSSAQNACQRLAPLAVSATQKFLSQSRTINKKYTVKDHYEFDQKVRYKYFLTKFYLQNLLISNLETSDIPLICSL